MLPRKTIFQYQKEFEMQKAANDNIRNKEIFTANIVKLIMRW